MSHKDDFNKYAESQNLDFDTHSTELKPTLEREQETLEEQRDKPQAVLEYTIGGAIEKEVDQQVCEVREDRISEIQKQLEFIREARCEHDKEYER